MLFRSGALRQFRVACQSAAALGRVKVWPTGSCGCRTGGATANLDPASRRSQRPPCRKGSIRTADAARLPTQFSEEAHSFGSSRVQDSRVQDTSDLRAGAFSDCRQFLTLGYLVALLPVLRVVSEGNRDGLSRYAYMDGASLRRTAAIRIGRQSIARCRTGGCKFAVAGFKAAAVEVVP